MSSFFFLEEKQRKKGAASSPFSTRAEEKEAMERKTTHLGFFVGMFCFILYVKLVTVFFTRRAP